MLLQALNEFHIQEKKVLLFNSLMQITDLQETMKDQLLERSYTEIQNKHYTCIKNNIVGLTNDFFSLINSETVQTSR